MLLGSSMYRIVSGPTLSVFLASGCFAFSFSRASSIDDALPHSLFGSRSIAVKTNRSSAYAYNLEIEVAGEYLTTSLMTLVHNQSGPNSKGSDFGQARAEFVFERLGRR